jgi:hypothetical protein
VTEEDEDEEKPAELDAPKIKKIKFGDHVIPKNIPETQS